jgi:hypothetical protein
MILRIYEIMREENGWRRRSTNEWCGGGDPFKIDQERRDTRRRGTRRAAR